MAEVYLESRVQVVLENLSFTCTVDEARELLEQLQDVLPVDEKVVNTGGSFGFGPPQDEEVNDDE